jgi:hypothetical protein
MLSYFVGQGLWAYLDPGTGSMAFQVLVAGLLSGMVFFRSAVQAVKRYLAIGAK